MPKTFLVVAIIGFIATVNAFFPRRDRVLLIPSFFAAWVTSELAPWLLFWEVVGVTYFVATGSVAGRSGWIALALALVTCAGLVVMILWSRRTVVTMRDAIADLDIDEDAPRFPRSHVVFPILMRHRKGVAHVRNITFAEYGKKKVRLDVYKAADTRPGDRRPGILQIHGGGWVLGDKREQGVPLLNHLAVNGWVGVNANYRLSPRAKFPDHLVDLKKAIAWYREHAEEHGADPDFLCVSGGSAGGHLAALVALTPNDPEYQADMDDVDTSVHAAVPFYGVYDMTNRHGRWQKDTVRRFFGPVVLGTSFEENPDAFRKASPMDLVRADAPPFFVVHGSNDTLVPVADAREFVELLRAASDSPVLYAEMQGAEHAFEVFPSFRTARVIEGVERFLHSVHEQYLRGREDADVSEHQAAEELVDN
jgi:acetyl esterase/lipase